jgi:hypothetical protein
MRVEQMSKDDRKYALNYLMFLKRKQTGQVKGRGCADGRKQREYISKEDATSPTVAIEAVFLTAVVDAFEGRSVVVVDVPRVFMQADMDKIVYVRFNGEMVEMLVKINPIYQQYVTHEQNDKVIYVKLLKALYGTLRAARLFWEKLSNKMIEWGFTPNPYDSCVCNKDVNGHQMTIAWHVDDIKISHKSEDEVQWLISMIEAEFGKEAPLTQSTGKVLDYLGMRFNFNVRGQVQIDMEEYVKSILHHANDDMKGVAVTPASNYLFQTNDDSVKLDHDCKEQFVHLVMQLLYLSQRGRPDIRTAVSFLCTRLHDPDEDDYKKLSRVIKYLRGTTDLTLTLQADKDGVIQWWVDASYAVHPEMKGHTRGTLSLGKGSIYSTSSKQTLVSRSSTESEVIGVHDVLPQILWTNHFLQAQGFNVRKMVLYQDNTSSILLEKNGRSSSSKRTRHMNIWFFFIKDRVAQKEIEVEHCPTESMVADYFTKPLQGQLCYKMRDIIMNIDVNDKYHSNQRSVMMMIMTCAT